MGKIEYAELARKLWPFLAGYVGQYGGGYSVLTAAASSTSTSGSAPGYASFLTLGTDPDLTAERVFTPGATLSATDGGAGSTYTLGVNQAGTFTWTGAHTFNPSGGTVTLSNSKAISTSSFSSGFAGSGLRLDQGVSYASQTTLEVDNVIVRGLMRVYELVINKIRVSRGSLIVSPGGGKVSAVSGSGPYVLTFDDDHGILANDLLRAQKFTGSGTYTSLLTVTSVTSTTATCTLSSGSAPAAGYEYAVVGNTSSSSRQGGLFLTADDSGAPFLDIYDGVAAHSDFNTYGKTKARLGKLTGITDSFFGTLSGYGLYTSRAYLSGAYINGSLVIGPGVGFAVTPLLYCAYDNAPSSSSINTNGHLGQPATVSGGAVGAAGKFDGGGALQVAEAVTNLCTNPSFETNTTGWTAETNCTITRVSDISFRGGYSLKCVTTASSKGAYHQMSLSASTQYTYSAWVYLTGTSSQTFTIGLTDLTDQGLQSGNITVQPNVWTRLSYTGTTDSHATRYLIVRCAVSATWYIDAAQCETGQIVTPYCDGSLGSGHSWSGTAHASTSARTAARVYYNAQNNIPRRVGSISVWFWAGTSNVAGSGVRSILNALGSSNNVILRVEASNALLAQWGATSVSAGTVTVETWHHAVVTADGTTVSLYYDGALINAASVSADMVGATAIDIGTNGSSSQYLNGYIDDLAIINRVLSADEVSAIYNSGEPLTITRSNHELLLADPSTSAKVVANAYGIFGTDASAKPTFNLINVDSTVNGESLTSGDTLLGDNSSGKGNVLFDQSAGALKIRSGTNTVLSFGSTGVVDGELNLGDGGIYQGSSGSFSSQPGSGTGIKIWKGNGTTDGGAAGDCIIGVFDSGAYTLSITPSAAITIVGDTTFLGKRAINFVNSSGTRIGEVYGYTDNSTYNSVRLAGVSTNASRDANVYTMAGQTANGLAYAWMYACKYTSPSTLLAPTAYVRAKSDQPNDKAEVLLVVQTSTGTSSFSLDRTGSTVTNGIKAFKIDHPLAPADKWLYHNSVEGDGHFTLYRGNVTLDNAGHATVQMPDWFDALNDDLVITYGDWGDATRARTSHRIPNGWVIVGQPRQRVSWIASGARRDAWAAANPLQVEKDKEDGEAGYVAAWQEYGLDESFAKPIPNVKAE